MFVLYNVIPYIIYFMSYYTSHYHITHMYVVQVLRGAFMG